MAVTRCGEAKSDIALVGKTNIIEIAEYTGAAMKELLKNIAEGMEDPIEAYTDAQQAFFVAFLRVLMKQKKPRRK